MRRSASSSSNSFFISSFRQRKHASSFLSAATPDHGESVVFYLTEISDGGADRALLMTQVARWNVQDTFVSSHSHLSTVIVGRVRFAFTAIVVCAFPSWCQATSGGDFASVSELATSKTTAFSGSHEGLFVGPNPSLHRTREFRRRRV